MEKSYKEIAKGTFGGATIKPGRVAVGRVERSENTMRVSRVQRS